MSEDFDEVAMGMTDMEIDAAITTYVVVWEWENRPHNWRPYSPQVTQLLERAHLKKLNKIYLKDSDPNLMDYYIDMSSLEQCCDSSHDKYSIRREFYPLHSPGGRGVKWEWATSFAQSATWHTYDMDIQCTLESAYNNFVAQCELDPEVVNLDLTKNGHVHCPYVINFANMTHVKKTSGIARPIRRSSQSVYPRVKLTQTEVSAMIHRKENEVLAKVSHLNESRKKFYSLRRPLSDKNENVLNKTNCNTAAKATPVKSMKKFVHSLLSSNSILKMSSKGKKDKKKFTVPELADKLETRKFKLSDKRKVDHAIIHEGKMNNNTKSFSKSCDNLSSRHCLNEISGDESGSNVDYEDRIISANFHRSQLPRKSYQSQHRRRGSTFARNYDKPHHKSTYSVFEGHNNHRRDDYDDHPYRYVYSADGSYYDHLDRDRYSDSRRLHPAAIQHGKPHIRYSTNSSCSSSVQGVSSDERYQRFKGESDIKYRRPRPPSIDTTYTYVSGGRHQYGEGMGLIEQIPDADRHSSRLFRNRSTRYNDPDQYYLDGECFVGQRPNELPNSRHDHIEEGPLLMPTSRSLRLVADTEDNDSVFVSSEHETHVPKPQRPMSYDCSASSVVEPSDSVSAVGMNRLRGDTRQRSDQVVEMGIRSPRRLSRDFIFRSSEVDQFESYGRQPDGQAGQMGSRRFDRERIFSDPAIFCDVNDDRNKAHPLYLPLSVPERQFNDGMTIIDMSGISTVTDDDRSPRKPVPAPRKSTFDNNSSEFPPLNNKYTQDSSVQKYPLRKALLEEGEVPTISMLTLQTEKLIRRYTKIWPSDIPKTVCQICFAAPVVQDRPLLHFIHCCCKSAHLTCLTSFVNHHLVTIKSNVNHNENSIYFPCPACGNVMGQLWGNCPSNVKMSWKMGSESLPPFPNHHTIQMVFSLDSSSCKEGSVVENYVHNGVLPFTSYLPNNSDGRQLLKMFTFAFDRKLILNLSSESGKLALNPAISHILSPKSVDENTLDVLFRKLVKLGLLPC